MIYQESIKTTASQQMLNVTEYVQKAVEDSGIRDGFVILSVPHTTAGITINENTDPNVGRDILRRLEKVFPVSDPMDGHAEGNSAAHCKSSFMGTSLTLMVEDSRLVLGTWQGIFFCEFDGPRIRKLIIGVYEDR
ncbi:MAG: secondary thiamine-phosphate synthase enzyme YjbQ [Candidatus Riflebacteria bacterium]|nr:YjbQ family protein [Candidatus Riflebacteria bacterium]MBR4571078.1 secondary thiamine-phosphate synthase enzyme YjbQ [Candidatus Riflebacteria bacterium]